MKSGGYADILRNMDPAGKDLLFTVTDELGEMPPAAEAALRYAAYAHSWRKYAEELAKEGHDRDEIETQLRLMNDVHLRASRQYVLLLSEFEGDTVKERLDKAVFLALRGSLRDGRARPNQVKELWTEEDVAEAYAKWFGKAEGMQAMKLEAAALGEAEFAKLLERYSEDRK